MFGHNDNYMAALVEQGQKSVPWGVLAKILSGRR